MKEILNKLHLSIREFADLYEIPYQTVRQWTVGERRMPEYLKKLIEKDIERNTKGEQLSIEEKTYYLHYINGCLTYIYDNEDTAKQWQSFCTNITKARETSIVKITEKNREVIMHNENLL